jgi:hypothetical protein
LWFNVVALPFGVLRRSHFADDLSFDEALPPCEDWDLWLRCAQLRPIAAVPQVLYEYHQHGGDRVTKEGSGDRGGRQAFVDKHRSSMTPACRAYHRATLAHQTEGRGAMLRQLASEARTDPVTTGFRGPDRHPPRGPGEGLAGHAPAAGPRARAGPGPGR